MNKYIKKLLCYSAISSLFLSETSSASVYKLEKAEKWCTVELNKEEFENMIKYFCGNDMPSGPQSFNHIYPFLHQDTQMSGAAVFYEGEEETSTKKASTIYIARKTPLPSSNSQERISKYDALSSFQESDDYDHTERQLVCRLIKDYNIDENTSGHMCIFTASPPCRDIAQEKTNDYSEKRGMPCVEYYKKLSEKLPQIKFHIYFDRFDNISQKSVTSRCTTVEKIDKVLTILGHEELKSEGLDKKIKGINNELRGQKSPTKTRIFQTLFGTEENKNIGYSHAGDIEDGEN